MSQSAKVNVKEIDQSVRVASFPGLYNAIVIPAYKGPINKPVMVTSENQFLRNFTPNNTVEVGYDLSYYSALTVLENTNRLWVVRAANEAIASGATIRSIDSSVESSTWETGMEDPEDYLFDLAPDTVATTQQTTIKTHADIVIPAEAEVTNIATTPDFVTPATSEICTLTCPPDTSNNLNSKYFNMEILTPGLTLETLEIFFDTDGSGVAVGIADRAIKVVTTTDATAPAVAAALEAALNSDNGGLSFNVTRSGSVCTVLYNEAGNVKDAIDVDSTVAVIVTQQGVDDISSLDGGFFILQENAGTVGCWYNISGSTIPPTGATSTNRQIEITTVNAGSSAAEISQDTASAILLDGSFEATGFSNIITITNQDVGDLPNAVDGNTGFTFTIPVEGKNAESSLQGKGFEIQDKDGSVGIWIDIYQEQQITRIQTVADIPGGPPVPEVTDFSVTGTPVAGEYFTLYESGLAPRDIYYAVDGGVITPPATGTSTPLKVDVMSWDNSADVAAKTAAVIGADGSFSATNTAGTAQVDTLQVTLNATALSNLYFVLNNGTDDITFWYDLDGTGTAPAVNATEVAIAVVTGETIAQVLVLTTSAVDGMAQFGCTDDAVSILTITMTPTGPVTHSIGNSTFTLANTLLGVAGSTTLEVTNAIAGDVPDALDGIGVNGTGFIITVTIQGQNTTSPASLEGSFFYLYQAATETTLEEKIAVWFQFGTTPTPAFDVDVNRQIIVTTVAPGDSDVVVANKLQSTLNADNFFSASVLGSTLLCTSDNIGKTLDATDVSTGFTIETQQEGVETPPAMLLLDRYIVVRTLAAGASADEVAAGIAVSIQADDEYTASSILDITTVLDNVAGLRPGETLDIDSGFIVLVAVEGLDDVTAIDEVFILYSSSPGKWGDSVSFTLLNYLDDPDQVKIEGAFQIDVYYDMVLLESFICSRDIAAIDGFGRSMFIENVLEASGFIRAMNNEGIDYSITPRSQSEITPLGGGDNGFAVTDGDMMIALESLQNPDDITVNVIVDGGRATPAWGQALNTFASNRTDCIAMLSVDYAAENSTEYVTEIVNYRKLDLAINSSYAALYSSHLLTYDKFNGRELYVSPEAYAAQRLNFTAQIFDPWYPAAGNTRGVINVLDTKIRFTEGERDTLYNVNINPIKFDTTGGIIIWGQKTLQTKPSSLDRVNVRMLLIVIEPAIKRVLQDFLFELNDITTRTIVSLLFLITWTPF